jgi:hypothetical protein
VAEVPVGGAFRTGTPGDAPGHLGVPLGFLLGAAAITVRDGLGDDVLVALEQPTRIGGIDGLLYRPGYAPQTRIRPTRYTSGGRIPKAQMAADLRLSSVLPQGLEP